jgi:Rps23 Pro-64 3,4-dihydroxylase Tpa1-like proline 4-hydroxylase
MLNYSHIVRKKIANSKIIILENFLKKSFYEKIAKEITWLQKNKKCDKNFILNKKIIKKEFTNYNNFRKNQKKLISLLNSKTFKIFLKKELNIRHSIFAEKSKMFSGFNIAENGSYLRPHADFNFNNYIKKFRTINLLLYFNNNWKKVLGGNLLFYNYKNLKKKYEFIAKKNRAIIFLTNKYTIHGYSKIKSSQYRISLNFYYYTNKNLSFDEKPHKTIWR